MHDFPGLPRKEREGVPDGIGLWFRGGLLGGHVAVPQTFQRGGSPEQVDGLVAADRAHPGCEARGLRQAGQAAAGLGQSFLGGVLRQVPVAEHGLRKRHQGRVMALAQSDEAVDAASQGCLDQLLIRRVRQRQPSFHRGHACRMHSLEGRRIAAQMGATSRDFGAAGRGGRRRLAAPAELGPSRSVCGAGPAAVDRGDAFTRRLRQVLDDLGLGQVPSGGDVEFLLQ